VDDTPLRHKAGSSIVPDIIAAEKPLYLQKRRTENMMLKMYSAIAFSQVFWGGVALHSPG
jgi:hypothetical protein